MGPSAEDADRFALRVMVGVGTLAGAFAGLLIAARIQWRLRRLGVDPNEVGPALIIVAVCAALAGLATWRAVRVKRPSE